MTEPSATSTERAKRKPATEAVFVKNVAIILYRDPIEWPKEDIAYLREQGILVIKSPNLTNDMAVRDLTTYRAHGKDASLGLIHKAALQSIGYNRETFANKVLELARAETSKSAECEPDGCRDRDCPEAK